MGAGAMGGAAAGAADPDAGADTDAGYDSDVVVTITKNGDGSYMVYAGDEPDSGGGPDDTSDDDADAMGGSGAAPAPTGGAAMGGGGSSQGTPADSIGAALKAALDILNSDKSSEGAPGDADSQFAAGYSAPTAPTPATGMAQKY